MNGAPYNTGRGRHSSGARLPLRRPHNGPLRHDLGLVRFPPPDIELRPLRRRQDCVGQPCHIAWLKARLRGRALNQHRSGEAAAPRGELLSHEGGPRLAGAGVVPLKFRDEAHRFPGQLVDEVQAVGNLRGSLCKGGALVDCFGIVGRTAPATMVGSQWRALSRWWSGAGDRATIRSGPAPHSAGRGAYAPKARALSIAGLAKPERGWRSVPAQQQRISRRAELRGNLTAVGTLIYIHESKKP
jgi:hypothetical protein